MTSHINVINFSSISEENSAVFWRRVARIFPEKKSRIKKIAKLYWRDEVLFLMPKDYVTFYFTIQQKVYSLNYWKKVAKDFSFSRVCVLIGALHNERGHLVDDGGSVSANRYKEPLCHTVDWEAARVNNAVNKSNCCWVDASASGRTVLLFVQLIFWHSHGTSITEMFSEVTLPMATEAAATCGREL